MMLMMTVHGSTLLTVDTDTVTTVSQQMYTLTPVTLFIKNLNFQQDLFP